MKAHTLMQTIARANRVYLSKLVNANNFQKLALVQEGADAMRISAEVRKCFEIMARELFKLCKYVEHNEVTDDHRAPLAPFMTKCRKNME